MSKSLLLKLAQDSIAEVFEAKNIINRQELLAEYPALSEPIATFIHLYIDNELCGFSGSFITTKSLLENVIHHAKAAAFESEKYEPITVSKYLHARIELSLLTPFIQLQYDTIKDLESKILPFEDGLTLHLQDKTASFLPIKWSEHETFEVFIAALLKEAGISDFSNDIKVYTFQVQKQSNDPILN
ncbi:AMMECR1 domain-containing protein [Sulfurimonas sp. MAG313]|nr:AMMECR1 domain-containing protein [Sulfurimonas sp. MAG313]MDF1880635.1 AMMECR1 domain-containing protein [Sulfurimonas sp. MAG313]